MPDPMTLVAVLAATVLSTAHAAEAQTGMNGPTDIPTGYSTLPDPAIAASNDIDAIVQANQQQDTTTLIRKQGQLGKTPGKSKASKLEQQRGQKMRQLAATMQQNLDMAQREAIAIPERGILHQFQRAWEKAKPDAGVFEQRYCPACTYKMQVRELMVSTIELPKGEVIRGFDIGDQSVFSAEQRTPNSLAIMAAAYGTDTNINIYTESGRLYPIYVRALDVQSPLLPDLLFRVIDPNLQYTEAKPMKTIDEVAKTITAPERIDASAIIARFQSPHENGQDFVQNIPFDPGALTGFDQYRISGSADRKLEPVVVFRDDRFTYIQWRNFPQVSGVVAYAVTDGIDEYVNTRIDGETFIIEAVHDLISIKSGHSYLCLEWQGGA